METNLNSTKPTALRPEVLENHRLITEREATFRKYGFDLQSEIVQMMNCTRPVTGHVLEIGTGKGRFLMSLAGENIRVTTVDNDAEAMASAKLNAEYHGRLGQIEWVQHNAESLPWPDHTFDSVVSMLALHHMTQVWTVLAEAHRVVKTGGKLVLGDFSPEGFDLMDKIHQAEGGAHPRGTGSMPEFQSWLEKHGYRVTKKGTRLISVLVAQQ
jgi:ubiquinone/menaquinone biosynthesis C-methylase UbiE